MPDRVLMPDRVHQPFVNRPSTGRCAQTRGYDSGSLTEAPCWMRSVPSRCRMKPSDSSGGLERYRRGGALLPPARPGARCSATTSATATPNGRRRRFASAPSTRPGSPGWLSVPGRPGDHTVPGRPAVHHHAAGRPARSVDLQQRVGWPRARLLQSARRLSRSAACRS